MDSLVKRYKLILNIGILIVIISFLVGILRLFNQAYLGGSIIEEILRAYTEIVPLYGLGILKLGIGFAIVTIVINLRATSKSVRTSLEKIDKKPPEMQLPVFGKLFPKLLVLGILIETVAVLVAIGWMVAGAGIFDSGLLHIFEVLSEPIEGLGVSLLIGGIALGLAMVVRILGRQASILPVILTDIVSGKKSDIRNIQIPFPKWNLILTVIGMIITATGLLPIAFVRLNTNIWHPVWENWMFIGVGILLFSIAFWLLNIIKLLRAQRENLGKTVAYSIGIKAAGIEPQLSNIKLVPFFAVIGLLWMIAFFGFALLGDNGLIGSFNPLVRPGKAIGMAIIFLGIGVALMSIVVNLRLTALMLPGAFSKIVNAIKGEKVEVTQNVSVVNPMSLAPKKLYLGLILGTIVATLGTLPLALIRVVVGPNDPLFFIVERMIGTTVALGIGLIFFFIGMFFNTIVTFVLARRTLISEGVETCAFYDLEKRNPKK